MLIAVAEPVNWVALALQGGGAIGMGAMFLWYLSKRNKEDDEARQVFLNHLSTKDAQHLEAMKEQMQYLKDRDAQSKEIAMSGHEALRSQTEAISLLRDEIRERVRFHQSTSTEAPTNVNRQ
jgi:Flp pilus assembly protein TadB